MVDARHSVLKNGLEPEVTVLDAALETSDDEVLKSKSSKGELSNVQITVGGGAPLTAALGSLFSESTNEEEPASEHEPEPEPEKTVSKENKPLSEHKKIALAKKQEDERKAMRERKRKELEQKFLKERFAERKKLNAAKRGMDPRAFDEVRKKIHKMQADRVMDDADGKFELSDEQLDAAIEKEQRQKKDQTAQMKRSMHQLMGMTQKLMAGIPQNKKQEMSKMMQGMGMGKMDKLMQRMMTPTTTKKNAPEPKAAEPKVEEPKVEEPKVEKKESSQQSKAAKKRAKRLRQRENKKKNQLI